MKRLFLITTILGLSLALFLAGQTRLFARSTVGGSEAMSTANHLYESGQFALAAQAYQQIVGQGYADGSLFYNLGNAYFKQGDMGQAILNYRRAEQLTPRDPDLAANLALARSQTLDQLEMSPPTGFASRLTNFTVDWLTLDTLASLTLSLWFLFAVLLILYRHSQTLRQGLQTTAVVTGLVLVLGLASLGSRVYVEHAQPAGVIVAAEVSVASSPNPQDTTEFSLHSGAEVNLIEQRAKWVRIALPGAEAQGWVPAETVERVATYDEG